MRSAVPAQVTMAVLPSHRITGEVDSFVWSVDENGNEIELKDDDDDTGYQPGRFRDDDYDRYQDVGSESEFADAGFTMKETSDDDDFAVGAEADAGEDDLFDGED